jgi:PIN domain nuclease of toxin-antitoxin system
MTYLLDTHTWIWWNMNNDPADQIIVATARKENATILTKNEKILAYKNVRSLW